MRLKFFISFIGLLLAQVFFVVAHAQTLPIPPTILKPDTSAITTAKPFIAGVSPNDTIVEITVDGAIIGNTITNNHSSGTGNFFFQVEQPIITGIHTIEARSIDISDQGLKSELSKSLIVTIIPFGAPTLLLNDETLLTRAFTYFEGVAHQNSRIHVFIDDVDVETFEVGEHPSGAVGFSRIFAVPIKNGEHAIYLRAEDESGRFSLASQSKKIRIVDFPAPTILTPVSGSETIIDTPLVSGIAFNESKVKIFVNGHEDGEITVKNTPSGIGTFSYTIVNRISRGQSFTVYALAYDKKGRISNDSNHVDSRIAHYYIPPTLFAVSGKSRTPLVTGVAHNDSTIAIFVDGKRDSTITPVNHPSGTLYFEARIQTPLSSGARRITAQAFDAMKKPSEKSNTIVVTYTDPASPKTPEITKSVTDEKEQPKEEQKTEPKTGEVTTDDEEQSKITTDTEEETQSKETAPEEVAQKTSTNWPLFLGVLLLVVLAIIFIAWYLGSKRQLLNEGIDKLFSEDDDSPTTQSDPSLFLDNFELPKKIDSDRLGIDDIPPPPPSI